MNKAIPILLLSLAALLTGCVRPSNTVIDGPFLTVTLVEDTGEKSGRSYGRYECWVYNPLHSGNSDSRFVVYTDQRFSVGDRVVITRVPMEDIKVEKKGGN